MPKLDTAQRLGLSVHAPEHAHVPSQTLAHSQQYSRSGLFDRGSFRQDLRDRVLHAEAFLGPFSLGQVEHARDTLHRVVVEARDSDEDWHTAAVFVEVLFLERFKPSRHHVLRSQPLVLLAPV